MKAKIVIGLGFGDEGKGLTVDYLASKLSARKTIVVRYTGGHQAGHTVMIDGVKHVHSSYGSGTLRGLPSYISEYCCFYPPNMRRENDVLLRKGIEPELYIHPLAKLTTPYDIAYNRLKEKKLKHGSCGIGIGATMERSNTPYKLHAVDTLNQSILNEKLSQIAKYYHDKVLEYTRSLEDIRYYEQVVDEEMKFFTDFDMYEVAPYGMLEKYESIIFEGAQGIMLDMDFGIFPNVTYGYTTSRNAVEICKTLGIKDIDVFYVTRCYQTRHGNGWMSLTNPVYLINNEEEINTTNPWQGDFRTMGLDYNLLSYAITCDKTFSYPYNKHMVVTCLDQLATFDVTDIRNLSQKHMISSVLGSYGPESKNISLIGNPIIYK